MVNNWLMDGQNLIRRRPYTAAGDEIHAQAAKLQGMVEAWAMTFDPDSEEHSAGLVAAAEIMAWRGKWKAGQLRRRRAA